MKRRVFIFLLALTLICPSFLFPFAKTAHAADSSTWYKTTDTSNVDWLMLTTNGTTNTMGVAPAIFSLADMVLEMDVKPVTNPIFPNWAHHEIYFGYQDVNNYYYITVHGGSGAIGLYKKKNGTATKLADSSSPSLKHALNTSNRYKITVLSGAIQVFANDTLLLSATDSVFTSGKVGVGVAGFYNTPPSTVTTLTLAIGGFKVSDSTGADLGGNIFVGGLADWTFTVPKLDLNRFEEHFVYTNGWEVPADAEGWATNASGLGAGYKAEVHNQKLYIESASGGSSGFYIKKTLAAPYSATKVIITYKLHVNEISGTSELFPGIIGSTGTGTIVPQFRLTGSGELEAMNGSTATIVTELQAGREYEVWLVIDTISGQQDIYIGDDDGNNVIMTNQTVANPVDSVQGIAFNVAGKIVLDDLVIEEYNATTAARLQQIFTQNAQSKVDHLPDLQTRLPQGILLSLYSSDVYADGTRTKLNADDDTILPVVQNGDVLLPKDFVTAKLGATSVTAETIQGRDYVSIQAVAAEKNLYVWNNGTLYAVSDDANLFTAGDVSLLTGIEQTFGIYVSPQGSDTNNGTYHAPFLTLEKARDVVRQRKGATGIPAGGITVYLMGGQYSRSSTLTLDASDSGRAKAPITYRSYPGQSAKLSGAKTIPSSAFSAVMDPAIVSRLKDGYAGKVIQADLYALGFTTNELGSIQRTNSNTQSLPDSTALYIDGTKQTIARWPNQGFVTTGPVSVPGATGSGAVWQYNEQQPNSWGQADQLWVEGYWFWDWYIDSMRVTDVDTTAKTIAVEQTTPYGVAEGKRYYVFNLLEEIDMPGEWFLDRTNGILYVYAPHDISQSDIQLSSLNTTLVKMTNASHIQLIGLDFADTNHRAIEMTGTDSILIAASTFRNIGGKAVVIESSLNAEVADSDFTNIGKGGVSATNVGYRPTLAPANIRIRNNVFTRFSTVSKTSSPAVGISGVGITVQNNVMNEAPHQAIGISGNDNVIENNEIYSVVKQSTDAGAIYGGRDYTNQGNVIRNNLVHDITGLHGGGAHAIYLDDQLSGIHVTSNIFFNNTSSVFIHGGRDNVVDSNIVANSVNSASSIKLLNLSGGEANPLVQPPSGTLYTRYMAMPVTSDLWVSRFPTLTNLFSDEPYKPKYNTFTRNVLFHTNDIVVPDSALPTGTFTNNTTVTDASLFEDAANNNFNPLGDFGINGFTAPIYNEIGLKLNAYRTSYPEIAGFKLIYPQNNDVEIPAQGITLMWEPAIGANRYQVTVATDSLLTDVIYEGESLENYLKLDNLEYGAQDYYWKVQAISDSALYPDSKVNDAGTAHFTTALNEVTDNYELVNKTAEAENLHAAAVVGTDPGQFPAEALTEFQLAIASANAVINDANATQSEIDSALATLVQSVAAFKRKQVQGLVDLEQLLTNRSNWVADDPNYFSTTPEGGLTFSPSGNGYAGYNLKVPNYAIWGFQAGFDFTNNMWQGFSLRSQSISAAPWTTTSYLFVAKNNAFELQRFGPTGAFPEGVLTVPNTLVTSGTEHSVQFGALDVEDGVRLIVKIDGTTIFDYLDRNGYITDEGYIGIVSTGSAVLTLNPY
ncbi:hypothetical protein B1748_27785 [Paenibacillus sp. MY03]|uniref:right-handed parallel beta-helix repeat-containing protein n=1 Tax=Paenibacillus sp. MY03 TaxID=302980 RepID=UPI000B3C0260|nr:right-handed parallel beta-helix repeat-containing protein [Paenibacillus sp. MY03]OUS70791.1 hypothetical protein B1748_27785 [Paenibacillus sp. MY03]